MQLTECICPKCGGKHRMILNWIGKLPAKKFCYACQASNNNISTQYNGSGYAKVHGHKGGLK